MVLFDPNSCVCVCVGLFEDVLPSGTASLKADALNEAKVCGIGRATPPRCGNDCNHRRCRRRCFSGRMCEAR